MSVDDLGAAWEGNAGDWLAWARTPGHDVAFWEMNAPAFRKLGRMLSDLGHATFATAHVDRAQPGGRQEHRVRGLDSSPTLAEAARTAGGYEEVVCGDAIALPWPSDSCDLAVAFMCLMDMPDPAAAVREISRVLVPGGRLCIAMTHPLNGTPEFLDDYFTERVFDEQVDAGGLHMRFIGRERPIGDDTRALTDAGFVIEGFQELQPSAEAIARAPRLAAAAKRPWTLVIRRRARLD